MRLTEPRTWFRNVEKLMHGDVSVAYTVHQGSIHEGSTAFHIYIYYCTLGLNTRLQGK